MDELKPGKWYWVRIEDDWFPAMHDPKRCGGCTNEYTWEDFNNEVVEWQKINRPIEVKSLVFKLKKTFDAFRDMNEDRLKEIKNNNQIKIKSLTDTQARELRKKLEDTYKGIKPNYS